ncbi:MAG: hypothetical protein CO189_04670 [candidate division Zixibacteria bacterium CG_4_9_14_3_um_filter_46_8]|nr:MAG: hypothetical protein CO189_04670 [candidate division Zixibacteria bacterium CG_4_9_14_3_um_filter_46_8]
MDNTELDINAGDRPVNVLAVDDEIHICNLVAEMLELDGHKVLSTPDPKTAMKLIEEQEIDAVITDLVMPGLSGVDVLRKAKQFHPDAVLILMTGQPTLENAIAVLREGVYDYLVKPFTLDTLRMTFNRGISKQRLQRENIQLKELVNLHRISEAIGSKLDLNDLFKAIIETTMREFHCDAGGIFIMDRFNKQLEIKYQQGMPNGFFKPEVFDKDDPYAWKPLLNNHSTDGNHAQWIDLREIKAHLCHPISVRNEFMGQIHLLRTINNKPFRWNNLAALSLICSKAETAIERAMLLSDLENTYISTLSALANAVEARDKCTRDHNHRLFKIAQAIAVELGWDDARIRALQMGGMLHDLGKIGVPDAILNKPGPLTKEEFATMKTHPLLGVKIVENIAFLKPSLPYILFHHERYDGKGYPHGLAGEDIPIEGRLLAVVDTIDAITSDRPYRKGRGIDIAIQQLREHSGTQFDPHIVEICLKVLPRIKEREEELAEVAR